MTATVVCLVLVAIGVAMIGLGFFGAWLQGRPVRQEYDDFTPYGVLVTPEEWRRRQDEDEQSW